PETIPERMIYYPAVFSVLGAWISAIFIQFGWNKSWQVWPIPCVVGSYVGYVLGSSYSLISNYFRNESLAERKRRE
ncbi:15631_t:CDS:2, partial [Entrophospora sp. SA101]